MSTPRMIDILPRIKPELLPYSSRDYIPTERMYFTVDRRAFAIIRNTAKYEIVSMLLKMMDKCHELDGEQSRFLLRNIQHKLYKLEDAYQYDLE